MWEVDFVFIGVISVELKFYKICWFFVGFLYSKF